jgi:hypothetical protein
MKMASIEKEQLYEPLWDGEFRLLTINTPQPGQDKQQPLRCKIQRFKLSEFESTPTNESEDQSRFWPEGTGIRYDGQRLFHPYSNIKDREPAPLAVRPDSLQPDLSKNYIALSYVWGSPTPTRTVVINDVEVEVGENLYAALARLRDSEWVRRGIKVWADALCINQNDLDERAQQVQIMSHLYASAWQVFIWLGPETEDTKKAFSALVWLAREVGTEDKFCQLVENHQVGYNVQVTLTTAKKVPGFVWQMPVYNALRSFFANTYWHRLWILQELAMSRADAPVVSGPYSMTLRDLQLASRLFEDHEDRLGLSVSSSSELFASGQSHIVSKDRQLRNPAGRPEQQWRRLMNIMDVREHQHQPTHKHFVAPNKAIILSAISLARNSGATENRDKVFGLLGMTPLSQLTSIVPDYRKDVREIFSNFTEDLISRGDLSYLRLVQTEVGLLKIQSTQKTIFSKHYMGPSVEWSEEAEHSSQKASFRDRGKYLEVVPECPHELPSWTICLICSPAPLQSLPKGYHADKGLPEDDVDDDKTGYPIRDGDILQVSGVIIDTVHTLSAFNLREADESFPHNGSESPHAAPANAYGDSDGLRDALWRTIVADSDGQGNNEPPEAWRDLLSPRFWAANNPYSPRTSGLEFSLGTFMKRNERLMLPGGRELGEIIFGAGKLAYSRAFLKGYAPQGGSRAEDSESLLADGRFWAANVLAWRRLIGTGQGRVGLTVAAARDGDSIVVLKGCGMPMVLRPAGEGLWSLVGECYLHGMMRGEAAAMVLEGQAEMTEFRIC